MAVQNNGAGGESRCAVCTVTHRPASGSRVVWFLWWSAKRSIVIS